MRKILQLLTPKSWIYIALVILLLVLTAANPLPEASTPEAQAAPDNVKVTSPLLVEYEIECADVATVEVSIDTAAFDVIARKIMPVDCAEKTTQTNITKLYFDIFDKPTKAHISISTYDKFNRTIMMQTTYATISQARQESHLILANNNPLQITEPTNGSKISESSLRVAGTIEVKNSSPINLKLVSEEAGRILSHEAIFIPQNMVGKTYNFETTLTIPSLSEPTGVRLILQQSGTDIYGVKFSTSVLVTINQE